MAPVAGKYDTGSEQEYKTGPSDRSTMRIVNDFPGGKEIIGNRSLLYSIFRNLLENAIFYSKGTTVKVSLDKEDSTMYWISVEDDGVGIDNVHMTRIFERFYRVDKGRSRKIGGTGLGLSIVKNAVNLHGGSIRAVSAAPGPEVS